MSLWVVPVGDGTDAVLDEAHRVADLLGETDNRPPVVAVTFAGTDRESYDAVPPDEVLALEPAQGSFGAGAATVGDRVTALSHVADEREPRAVLAASRPDGDDLVARLAARLGGACVTDCLVRVRDGEVLAGRAVYEGRAYAEYDFEATPTLSVNAEALGTPETRPSEPPETTRFEVPLDVAQGAVRHVATLDIPEQDLARAQVIVAGGKGLGGPEGFEPVRDLADAVGGAVGASRPPADEGWVEYDRQVGVTGKEIAPELYVPVAISGDPYHMRSVTAEHLIPINTDPSARIFKFASLGIVGDAFEYAPTIAARIREASGDAGAVQSPQEEPRDD
jgi:electron transfer flavoprotein alpha subunit